MNKVRLSFLLTVRASAHFILETNAFVSII